MLSVPSSLTAPNLHRLCLALGVKSCHCTDWFWQLVWKEGILIGTMPPSQRPKQVCGLFFLIDDCCRRAQPTVGSTTPRLVVPEGIRE